MREGEGGRKRENWKVCFWNVAGLGNKDKDFWDGLEKWDVVVLIETWKDERGWKRRSANMSKGFKWRVQFAGRKNRKGRAMGGLVIGIKWKLVEKGEEIKVNSEGIIIKKVKVEKEKWRIIGVYINRDIEGKLQRVRDWGEGKKERRLTVIGGDFNARTGEEGGGVGEREMDDEDRKKVRRSKDGRVNREGRVLVEFIGERGWSIFNGVVKGDEEGEYTYTGGRGNTVIDYVIGDEEVKDKVGRLVVEKKVDSDHHPLEVKKEGGRVRERNKKEERRREWRGVWDEEGREKFRQILGEVKLGEEVQDEWEKLEKRVKRAVEGTERGREEEREKSGGWWDRECRERKWKVRKLLRKWRKGGRKE